LQHVFQREHTVVEFNLSGMHKKLEIQKYSGTITLQYVKGELVLIREERTIKPANYERFI